MHDGIHIKEKYITGITLLHINSIKGFNIGNILFLIILIDFSLNLLNLISTSAIKISLLCFIDRSR